MSVGFKQNKFKVGDRLIWKSTKKTGIVVAAKDGKVKLGLGNIFWSEWFFNLYITPDEILRDILKDESKG